MTETNGDRPSLSQEEIDRIADRKRRMAAAAKPYGGATVSQGRGSKRGLVIALTTVILALALGLAWALYSLNKTNNETKNKVTNATLPPHATPDKGGIKANTTPAKSGAPTLAIYQDFQCPICKEVEMKISPTINKLMTNGQVNVEYRIRSFIDRNVERALGKNIPTANSSLRSASAASCADTVGSFPAYHSVVFKNQPAEEGHGYTEEQLRVTFPQEAGITGQALTTFQKCYDDKTMEGFVASMEKVGGEQGNTSTPELRLNGKALDLKALMTQKDYLEKQVAAATKK